MADGFAPACDIHIAAVGTVPVGLAAVNIVLSRSLTLVVISTDASLAKIVKTRPDNVADDVGIAVYQCPILESIAWITLRLPHHTPRIALMVGSMLMDHVVVTTNIKHIEVRIVDFPVIVPGTERLSHWARLVVIQNGLLQLTGRGNDADILTLYHLVADAPADDAGMIAVTLHHRTDILSIARVNQRGIIVGLLGRAPAVEGFTDNEHS